MNQWKLKWDIFEGFSNTVLRGNKAFDLVASAQNFFLIFHDKGDDMDALIYTSYGSAKANCVKTWSTMHEEDMSKGRRDHPGLEED